MSTGRTTDRSARASTERAEVARSQRAFLCWCSLVLWTGRCAECQPQPVPKWSGSLAADSRRAGVRFENEPGVPFSKSSSHFEHLLISIWCLRYDLRLLSVFTWRHGGLHRQLLRRTS